MRSLLLLIAFCVPSWASAQPLNIPLEFVVGHDAHGQTLASSQYIEWIVEKANRWLEPSQVCLVATSTRYADVPVSVDHAFDHLADPDRIRVGISTLVRRGDRRFAGYFRTRGNASTIMISRVSAGDRTLAHEIGHILGLQHHDDPAHVMHQASPNLRAPLRLSGNEVRLIRSRAQHFAESGLRCRRAPLYSLDSIESNHPLLFWGERRFDDRRYVGELLFGREHGTGTSRWRSGALYDGEHRVGRQHGFGRRHFENGDVYIGRYHRGEKSGRGIYIYASGDVFRGTYRRDRRHGRGHYFHADGGRWRGRYENGRRVHR